MDWLTMEEVERAAKKGRKAAIECSKKHWKQLSRATKDELSEVEEPYSIVKDLFCALCHRYRMAKNSCKRCPLYDSEHDPGDNGLCCEECSLALEYYGEMCYDRTEKKFEAWQKTAKAMYRKLCRVE